MPESEDEETKLEPKEQAAVKRARDFTNMGSAYARFHGQRPATIGLILSTSPLALLAWSVARHDTGKKSRHQRYCRVIIFINGFGERRKW